MVPSSDSGPCKSCVSVTLLVLLAPFSFFTLQTRSALWSLRGDCDNYYYVYLQLSISKSFTFTVIMDRSAIFNYSCVIFTILLGPACPCARWPLPIKPYGVPHLPPTARGGTAYTQKREPPKGQKHHATLRVHQRGSYSYQSRETYYVVLQLYYVHQLYTSLHNHSDDDDQCILQSGCNRGRAPREL